MKRLITFLLALILFTLPGWNITADAQGDELVLSLSSVEASPGDTIELVVSIESNPGIAGMQFGFSYDNSKLELLKGEPTGGLGGMSTFFTQYVWVNSGNTTYTGEIFKLSFKVKDNISEGGLTEVGITGAKVGNWAQEELPYQIKPGGVNILIKHNLERVEAKSATCTEAGNITYWKCTDCGKLFRDGEGKEEIDAQSIVLPSLGHNAGHFAAVDPTCQDTGNIEYWHCDRCNKYFSDKTCENKVSSVVLATVPHDFNTLWQYDKDYHWHECAYGCGTTDAKSSHSLEWVVDKEATCTAPGVWHQECKICGYKTNEDTEIPMVSHNLTHHNAVEATCTSEGNIEYWECSGCHKLFRDVNGETEVQSVTTNKLSHNFETDLKYDKDYHWHECAYGCGTTDAKSAHSLEWVVDKEATCTAPGIRHQECKICGYKTNEGTEIPMVSHNLTRHDAVEATCTSEGNIEYWECSGCHKLFRDANGETEVRSVTIAKLPHTPGSDWDSDGNTHWHPCTVCNNKVEEADHDFVEEIVKEATCTEPGLKHQKCSICGYEASGVEIPTKPHTLDYHAAVEATCTSEGNIEYWECSVCHKLFRDANGETEVQSVTTNKLSHNFETELKYDQYGHWHECAYGCGTTDTKSAHSLEWVVDVPATCTEKGKRHQECECGYKTSFDTEIAALGHTLDHHAAVEATCTSEGNIEYWECSGCHKLFSDASGNTVVDDVTTAMLPHSYGSDLKYDDSEHWLECTLCGAKTNVTGHTMTDVIEQESTCTVPGRKYQECTFCDYETPHEVIPTKPHILTHHAAIEATCTSAGNIEYWECSGCHKLFSDADGNTVVDDVTTAMLPHSYGSDWKNNGSEHWLECTLCGAKTDVSAHTLIEVIDKPSTCTERGVKHHECTICGYKSNAVEIDKLGHTLIDVPAKAASCQEDGNIAHRKCSRCGMLFDLTGNPIAEQDVIIPADPTMHVLKEIAAKTSTCTEHGNIVYYECSVCRAKFADKAMQDPLTDEDIELPLLPHSIDIKKWNADENYHWHECSVCGSRTDIKQHEFGPWIIQSTPTDKKDGLQTRTCSVCGYEQKQVKGKYDNEHPSTGDDSNIPLYLALIGASSVSAAAIALCYKKKVSRAR